MFHLDFTQRSRADRTYLNKGVHSHDGHVWLTLSVVHQVEVDQLFQFQVVRLHTIHNIWEQSTKKKNNILIDF